MITLDWLKRALETGKWFPFAHKFTCKIQQFDGLTVAGDGYRIHVYRGEIDVPDEFRPGDNRFEQGEDKFRQVIEQYRDCDVETAYTLPVDAVEVLVTRNIQYVVKLAPQRYLDHQKLLDAVPVGVTSFTVEVLNVGVIRLVFDAQRLAYLMPIVPTVVDATYAIKPTERQATVIARYHALQLLDDEYHDRIIAINDNRDYWLPDNGSQPGMEEDEEFSQLASPWYEQAKALDKRRSRCWALMKKLRTQIEATPGWLLPEPEREF